jgi:hypothetical protein
MACELLDHCHFFDDNMKDMPLAAEYLKAKLCYGNHELCNRFRMYQQRGGAEVECEPNHSDAEEVERLIQRLRDHQLPSHS